MNTEPSTRHSHALPELRLSLNLLYVGRLLLGMTTHSPNQEETLETLDEHIEEVTDELVATELLHEAALLAGDVLPPAEEVQP
ncbi:hypothetical protein [Tellurirhabdus bombi]|uniref:hypothetical protein n=1 Tax=Tellurirhabdus bombi TaxID=2907205 RepID=UPI001F491A96|nr:hypothetical protein [Tellurirhabdus bombi]